MVDHYSVLEQERFMSKSTKLSQGQLTSFSCFRLKPVHSQERATQLKHSVPIQEKMAPATHQDGMLTSFGLTLHSSHENVDRQAFQGSPLCLTATSRAPPPRAVGTTALWFAARRREMHRGEDRPPRRTRGHRRARKPGRPTYREALILWAKKDRRQVV